jgi:nicotinamidase-related amidase
LLEYPSIQKCNGPSGINIVFLDISTELGVKWSASDALNRDFYDVIVSDTVSSSDKKVNLKRANYFLIKMDMTFCPKKER